MNLSAILVKKITLKHKTLVDSSSIVFDDVYLDNFILLFTIALRVIIDESFITIHSCSSWPQLCYFMITRKLE